MVALRIFRVVVLTGLLALLVMCDFFTMSTFPATASQLSAQRDLSALIPASFSRTFTLSTVTAGNIDLVFLATQLPYDGTHLIVMDKDLRVLQAFSFQDLVSFGATFSNSGAQLGSLGDIVILGMDWTVSAAGVSPIAGVNVSSSQGSSSVTDGTWNYAGMFIGGNQMNYQRFNLAWTTVQQSYGPYTISPVSTANFNLVGVWDDPSITDVIVVLEETGTSLNYWIPFPRAGFFSGLAITPNLLSNYAYFTTPRTDNGLLLYSQNGLIKFQKQANGQGGTFVRLDMAGNTLPYSLRYAEDTDFQIATRNAGGWYYEYNRTTRMVRKFSAWWGQ